MKKIIIIVFIACIALSSCGKKDDSKTETNEKSSSQADATKTIAKEAYIYAYPMVQLYGIIYSYNINSKSPEYKGDFNKIHNVPKVFTPADKAIVTPNSDTPYSFLTMDLRAEPIVISVPEIEKDRYYSVMMLDLYTYIYGVIGSRATGNGAGKFLIAGPDWKGEKPEGIKEVFRCETQFSFVCFRTQLFNPADLKNVIKIQDQYNAEPLSAYLKTTPPPAPPVVNWPAFDPKVAERDGMLSYLNFLLQFCPVDKSETTLRANFEKIGVVPGKPFNEGSKEASLINAGYEEAMELMKETTEKDLKNKVSSGKFFGSREFLGDNYINRAIGAELGIGGLIGQEAEYYPMKTDASGQPINTAVNKYEVTFKAGDFPPVNAFWSFTMYDGKTQLLIENPINRYIINSPMLPNLKLNADSSLTIYIQKDSPGKDKESNWLPAPDGDAYVVLRCYWPKEAILNGTWKAPAITLVK
ncbi:MAG TPA: DUF1254 domain-containing protein [Ignavibacteria bacterium]|nr:DUF1254 domain-containing protein [Ignavibacteria bacterium]HMR39272.1 DUF1254 domain-containing protein [Ignavibacteria bacterium]